MAWGEPTAHYVRCRAEPGMFDDEFLVFVDAYDPTAPDRQKIVVQLLADGSVVELPDEPSRGNPVEGWLEVSLVEKRGGYAVVVLPKPGLPVGESMIVEEAALREQPEHDLCDHEMPATGGRT